MLKKTLVFLIIIATILPMLVSCGRKLTGAETAMEFLTHISESRFKSAYKLCSTVCSEEDFIKLYEDMFESLKIEGVTYTPTSNFDGDAYSEYNYKLTYHSGLCGDITEEYRIVMKLGSSNRLKVDWSPALIMPEMDYGDSITYSRLTAKRGEIVSADGAVLAQNVPVTSVSIITDHSNGYGEKEISDNVKLLANTLNIPKEEVQDKLCFHIYMRTADYINSKSEAVYDEAQLKKSRKKLAKFLDISLSEVEKALEKAKNSTALIATIEPNDKRLKNKSKIEELDGVFIRTSNFNGVALVAEYNPGKLDESKQTALTDKKGIIINESAYSSVRSYPYGESLAHVLGYLTNATEEDLPSYNEGRTEEQGLYTTATLVGANGIERAYEKDLHGSDGFRVALRSSTGELKRKFYEKPAENGRTIQLSIDFQLQQKAEDLLKNSLYDDSMAGAVIVMNPKTGEVQTMASFPSYNLNSFSLGMSEEEYAELSKKNAPFINRALYGYAPGSVFKPITAAAAIESGTIGYKYVFPGTIENDHWKPVINGASLDIKRTRVIRRNEPLNMRNALVHSDNIYFANATLLMGEETLENYWNKLGFNEIIPFDIQPRQSQFKSSKPEVDKNRTLQTVAETGFGQGTMLTTPIQLASVYCGFSNGGDIPIPYIVKAEYAQNGNDVEPVAETKPGIYRNDVFSSDLCKNMTAMLKDVVSPKFNGTGSQLYVSSCVVAGKTGTAEVVKNKKDNSWFIGYRTDVKPEDERLVLVVLEVPVGDQYTHIKLKIARSLLEIEG